MINLLSDVFTFEKIALESTQSPFAKVPIYLAVRKMRKQNRLARKKMFDNGR